MPYVWKCKICGTLFLGTCDGVTPHYCNPDDVQNIPGLTKEVAELFQNEEFRIDGEAERIGFIHAKKVELG